MPSSIVTVLQPRATCGCPALPEYAPSPCGMLTLTVGHRESAAEASWDLPPLAPGATSLLDVTATGCRQDDVAYAALASSTRVIESAAAWTSNTVRMMARNISPSATSVSPQQHCPWR
jgi:hypothetical protein